MSENLDCAAAFGLLDAHLDGELDLAVELALEEHLAACPGCRARLEEKQAFRRSLRAAAPAFTAPPALKAQIRARLREEVASASAAPSRRTLLGLFGGCGWNAWTLSCATAAVAVVLAGLLLLPAGSDPLLDEALADHTRSLLADHLTDVASTDRHTVKPWFAGRLDYSPTVVDTAPEGYPLIGGRLDILAHRTVAALVYQRRKHVLNLFVWPADDGALRRPLRTKDGYHTLGWSEGGMNYLLVSELAQDEFLDFARTFRARAAAAPLPPPS